MNQFFHLWIKFLITISRIIKKILHQNHHESGKGGFWRLPRSRHQHKPSKPARKRYRPPTSASGERKHNILSNIQICGAESDSEGEDKDEYILPDAPGEHEKEVKEQRAVVPASMPNQGVVIEPANQMLPEDELAGLLLASVGWDDCQLELLDSLLDSL